MLITKTKVIPTTTSNLMKLSVLVLLIAQAASACTIVPATGCPSSLKDIEDGSCNHQLSFIQRYKCSSKFLSNDLAVPNNVAPAIVTGAGFASALSKLQKDIASVQAALRNQGYVSQRLRGASAAAKAIDSNPSCEAWAQTGQCTQNPSYMNVACAASCQHNAIAGRFSTLLSAEQQGVADADHVLADGDDDELLAHGQRDIFDGDKQPNFTHFAGSNTAV
jgi:hypothetical protein